MPSPSHLYEEHRDAMPDLTYDEIAREVLTDLADHIAGHIAYGSVPAEYVRDWMHENYPDDKDRNL